MNQKLGSTARTEIRTAMQGLTGTAAKQEAGRLASLHGCSEKYIYKFTTDVRPENRKTRNDKGRRTFDLVEGTDVWYAAQLVIVDKLDPDQALLTCRTRGLENLPTLEYFRQMLNEKGLGKKQRAARKTGYRAWEAEFPGELFQIDVTALKVRWRDEKTRRIMRIEGVDKNHPQMDPTKIRVWQIMLTDDHSRVKYLRYFVARAITSTEMVRFECEAYDELGVPLKLYTDQGGEFKSRHKQAERIMNKIQTIAETGGYRHIAHAPNNAKATGKVENAHKWAEKMDRYVGLADTEGQGVTIEQLNTFAVAVCEYYNRHHVHRATGQTPLARWHAKKMLVRRLPRDIIESALLSDTFPARLDESMTVTFDKVSYRIPGQQPFVDYVGKRVMVVVPPNIGVILLTLPNLQGKFAPDHGGEYEIEKVIATADKAGEFKAVADSTAEILTKKLKDARKDEVRKIKDQKTKTGQIAPVPFFNVPIEMPLSNITHFPQAERIASREEIAAVVPLMSEPPASVGGQSAGNSSLTTHHSPLSYVGKPIGYWEAVSAYATRFASKDEAKQFLLGLFPDTTGQMPVAQLEAAIDGVSSPHVSKGHASERRLRVAS